MLTSHYIWALVIYLEAAIISIFNIEPQISSMIAIMVLFVIGMPWFGFMMFLEVQNELWFMVTICQPLIINFTLISTIVLWWVNRKSNNNNELNEDIKKE